MSSFRIFGNPIFCTDHHPTSYQISSSLSTDLRTFPRIAIRISISTLLHLRCLNNGPRNHTSSTSVSRRLRLRLDTDGSIKWDKLDSLNDKLSKVTVELVELGGPFVPRIPEVFSFGKGYVVTLVELVRLRASTLFNRGDESDHVDFGLLLSWASNLGLKLPPIGEEEGKLMFEAVMMYEGSLDAERLFIDVLGLFELRGVWYDGWMGYVQEMGFKAVL
ncbi:b41a90de-3cc4-49dd-9a41-21477065f329 [Sclerotinia trifoliorum]|uniref:B41a90de-3cc4-49dd-9a41-21477065f329 n=1 Tax=Sclerotinia trifoliorum TaxID=28548 RepID=A0A8H2W2N3_9HELO|nr:b41a90de-3cc4-49dd-9a41-21477065f329 [Sclerotinia trifoliorum]